MQDDQREEIIYLAGLFDGHGTICIIKNNRWTEEHLRREKNPLYTVTFQINLSRLEPIKYFMEFFKVGYLTYDKHRSRTVGMHRYSVKARDDAQMVIEKMHPFLRIKQPQAGIALMYFEDCPLIRGRAFTIEELNKREYYYQEMKKVNSPVSHPQRLNEEDAEYVSISDSLNS